MAKRTRRSRRPILETLEGRELMAAGMLDPTFGNGGFVTNKNIGPPAIAAVQPWNDKTIVDNGDGVFRYNTDGSLDTAFGTGGVAHLGLTGQVGAIVTDPATQKIYVVLSEGQPGYSHAFSVSRLNPNGSLDSTYGSKGTVIIVVGKASGGYWDTPTAASLDGQGRIVVVGEAMSDKFPNYYYQATILRLTKSGKLDSTFGSGGEVNGPSSAWSYDSWLAVQVQADNSITVAGKENNQQVIAHYSSSGSLLSNHLLQVPANPYNTSQTVGVGVEAFQSNGDLVTDQGLSAPNNDAVTAVVRYTPTGAVDTGFGSGGLALTDLTTAVGCAPGTLFGWGPSCELIDPSGRIVLGGQYAPIYVVNGVRVPGDHQQLLLRYTPTGALDTTFGNGGVTVSPLGSNRDSTVSSLVAEPDDKIIAVGWVATDNDDNNRTFAMARYLGDPAATTTALASSLNPSTYGQPVTFTPTVVTAGPFAPSGVVDLYGDGTLLGTGTLTTVGGVTTATFTISTLASGTHSLWAIYDGDANDRTSTSGYLSQVVS